MINKEQANIYFKEAFKFQNDGNYEKAKEYYEKVIALNPNFYEAYSNLANILAENFQQYEKAKEYHEKAIEINPDYDKAYNNLGIILQKHYQQYDKAKECYEKAIEKTIDNDAYFNLAILLQIHFQEYKKSKECYEKAIEINGQDPDVYNNLAILLEEHFYEYEKAKEYYEKSIEINSDNPVVYNNIAGLLSNHFNAHKKAEEYYKKAIVIDHKFPDSYRNLAILLSQLNDLQQASYYYEKYRHLSKPEKTVRKIENINLKNYNQFKKGTVLNFTYPKGHKKEGQPLNKVCIIGQSGTGKTSILELIKAEISNDRKNVPNANFESVMTQYKFYNYETEHTLINIPAHSVENIKNLDLDEILESDNKNISSIIDFGKTDPKEHWYPILHKITKYAEKVIDKRLKFSEKIENVSNLDEDLNDYVNKFKSEINAFKNDEENPLKQLSDFIEPILLKFNLAINKVPSKREDIKFIPIENITKENDKENRQSIETKYLSTGTKEILSRSVPLFSIKPRDTIILIDEPENSLYPNVQKDFVDFITKESWNNVKTCQFVFATHSPTIASSFDPWEIIELQFNNEGKVEQKTYFEGERHVDNYTIFPKYLDIDSILTRVFKVGDDLYQNREDKLDEFADYNIKIRKLEQKKLQSSKEYKILVEKRNKLGEKLDWRTK